MLQRLRHRLSNNSRDKRCNAFGVESTPISVSSSSSTWLYCVGSMKDLLVLRFVRAVGKVVAPLSFHLSSHRQHSARGSLLWSFFISVPLRCTKNPYGLSCKGLAAGRVSPSPKPAFSRCLTRRPSLSCRAAHEALRSRCGVDVLICHVRQICLRGLGEINLILVTFSVSTFWSLSKKIGV